MINPLIEDTMMKNDFILFQKPREEDKNDTKLKNIIELLFGKEIKSKDITFQNIEKEAQRLLGKLIGLIDTLFKMKKSEREQLLLIEVISIKNSNIITIIEELEALQSIEVTIENKKIDNLCNIIIKSLLKDR